MACRNRGKAEEARSRIYQHLQRFIETIRKQPGHDIYADVFLKNLSIDIQLLDLSKIRSVFTFSKTLRERYENIAIPDYFPLKSLPSYPYVSHLIMNAGIACFTGIDWICATKQVLTEPMVAFTMPVFNLQSSGDMSLDGLGYVWQSNVFGHYALVCLFAY
jgi:3-keto steroid reductase